jgi:lipopolysaccharide assembly outer membrane protein LptD (OstA)
MHRQRILLTALCAFVILQVNDGSDAAEVTGQTLNISAKHVSRAKTFFTAIGNARAFIEGEKAAVDADEISYNDSTGMMDVRGHVHLVRNGVLTTGEEFKFKVRSNDYLITEPPIDNVARPLTTKLSITEVSVDRRKVELEPIRTGTDYIDGK